MIRLAESLLFGLLAVVLDSSAAFTAVGRHHKHNNNLSSILRAKNLPEETGEEDDHTISIMSRRSLFQNSIAPVAATYLVAAADLRPHSAAALDFDDDALAGSDSGVLPKQSRWDGVQEAFLRFYVVRSTVVRVLFEDILYHKCIANHSSTLVFSARL